MKETRYKFLAFDTLAAIEEKVNEFTSQNWELLGPLQLSEHVDEMHIRNTFYCTLIKTETKLPDPVDFLKTFSSLMRDNSIELNLDTESDHINISAPEWDQYISLPDGCNHIDFENVEKYLK